ncbi:MAG TPA: tRNA (adenosine(37)-N6)-threonylcarbamoyltransferase complex ATPase subunit type 1 TsaE, partial [Kofleriaceae bacterium]|nr:tRNA (adenosine(37)-N6)-threonylcarbamoyltransferase complex ATPase subunit type 1 TsaE [Kofleriaceae bacterium]
MIPLPDLLATRRVGAVLAQVLQGGDVVAMLGDLGAGKTTLVDACVVALGGEGASSPTFALVQEIACAATTVWHADLYRLERADEVVELGLEE